MGSRSCVHWYDGVNYRYDCVKYQYSVTACQLGSAMDYRPLPDPANLIVVLFWSLCSPNYSLDPSFYP